MSSQLLKRRDALGPRLANVLSTPLVPILFGILLLTGFFAPNTLHPSNIISVIKMAPIMGIIALGQTLVILSGNVDFSTGYVTTAVLLFSSGLMKSQNENVLWASLACLAFGLFIGLINGLLVTRTKAESLVTTLAIGSVVQGLYLLYTGGAPKGGLPPIMRYIGASGRLFGSVPISIVVWLVLAAILWWVLRKTVFGRSIYHVGSNPLAAAYAGIHVKRVTLGCFLISGLTSAIAGLMLGGFLGVGTLQLNVLDFTFIPIISVIMGGTSFVGGIGGIWLSVLGVFTMQYLTNLLTIFSVQYWGKFILQGLLIGIIVTLNERRVKK